VFGRSIGDVGVTSAISTHDTNLGGRPRAAA
jgi:hypothetical protein